VREHFWIDADDVTRVDELLGNVFRLATLIAA
jgi:hypothetical protein